MNGDAPSENAEIVLPVNRVIALLQDAGYEVRNPRATIASVEFEFSAILTAREGLDLVVVVDTVTRKDSRVRRQLESLASALDLIGSRRPLTVVVVGPSPRQSVIEAMSRVGRVLLVGTPTGHKAEQSLRDALAVLLPLTLPEVVEPSTQSWDDLRRRVAATPHPDWAVPLLDAAPDGPDAVQEHLRRLIEAAIADGSAE